MDLDVDTILTDVLGTTGAEDEMLAVDKGIGDVWSTFIKQQGKWGFHAKEIQGGIVRRYFYHVPKYGINTFTHTHKVIVSSTFKEEKRLSKYT